MKNSFARLAKSNTVLVVIKQVRPFHFYTMKQAIEEGFILDVLKNYTPVESYYLLAKKLEGAPLYDSKKA